MKRIPFLFLFIAMTLFSFSALAEGNAPASQFGFQGWPYRQSTNCSARRKAVAVNCQAGNCEGKFTYRKPGGFQNAYRVSGKGSESGARPSSQVPKAPSVSTEDYTTLSASVQEQKLLEYINQDRARNGLAPLKEDQALSALARLKSQDMLENGYFAHESPTYGNAANMLESHGYAYRGVGENIAHHASAEKAEAAFMSSDGHRRNILGRQWTKVGVGIALDENGFVFATELFAR